MFKIFIRKKKAPDTICDKEAARRKQAMDALDRMPEKEARDLVKHALKNLPQILDVKTG